MIDTDDRMELLGAQWAWADYRTDNTYDSADDAQWPIADDQAQEDGIMIASHDVKTFCHGYYEAASFIMSVERQVKKMHEKASASYWTLMAAEYPFPD